MNKWLSMDEDKPIAEGYILFVPKEEPGEFYKGIALPSRGYVLLERTDMSFSEILYWLPVPEIPEVS